MPRPYQWCHELGCKRPLFRDGRCATHYRLQRRTKQTTEDPLEALWRLPLTVKAK